MRVVSLFSGAGGLDQGFADAGMRPSVACESDADARASLRANHAPAEVHDDAVALVASLSSGEADVIVGGPPCQGFSVAGRMDPDDGRSRLVSTFIEAAERARPQCFLMENVDALARLDRWSPILQGLVSRADAAGYGVAVRILDSSDYGVAQRRKRMFMWGVLGMSGPEVARRVDARLALSRRAGETVADILRRRGPSGTRQNPRTSTARITYAKKPVMRASPFSGMMFNGAGRPLDPSRPAPTIAASAGGNKTHFVDEVALGDPKDCFVSWYHARLSRGCQPLVGDAPERLRRITVAESRDFQGFPEGWVLAGSSNSQYRQVGNAVPVPLAEAVAYALKACLA